jgi:hypothetical protein
MWISGLSYALGICAAAAILAGSLRSLRNQANEVKRIVSTRKGVTL